ncbi:MAG: RNA polymerase sigma-70 factor [Gemmatimonadales bacterium]|nr:RNA polymerase sigma-70 factor [Gemmatimonadales bacterium]
MLKHPRRDAPAADAPSSPSQAPEPGQLERIRAGDESVFEELFKAYYRALCDFVYGYVRSRDTAEELVQTVFLRIWQKRESWEPVTGIRAYLFAACRNQALDHLRHQRIVDRVSLVGGTESEDSARAQPLRPDEAIHAAELSEALRRAVEDLPERRRAVLVLRWQHHLSNLEIARALGISVKGVEAHVTRALAVPRRFATRHDQRGHATDATVYDQCGLPRAGRTLRFAIQVR